MTTGEVIDMLQEVPRDTPFLIRLGDRWGAFVSAKVRTATAKPGNRARWGVNWNQPDPDSPTIIIAEQETA